MSQNVRTAFEKSTHLQVRVFKNCGLRAHLENGHASLLVAHGQHEVDSLDQGEADDGRAAIAAPETGQLVRLTIVPVDQPSVRPQSQEPGRERKAS